MDRRNRQPVLCDYDKCTACSACCSVCPVDAISMQEDRYGELHPKIDDSVCIGCLLCERTCPEISGNAPTKHNRPDVYCCWLKDSSVRRESTSGGAAYAVSKAVVESGGCVWGAAYGDEMSLHYCEAKSIADLRPLQKSKYVQSYVGDCFRQIREELQRGELVLFCGTGCHVKGLRAFLRKDYDNLMTLDLVCHGVPGQGVFKKYVEWLERKFEDKLVNYIPRHKRADGQEVGYYTMAVFAHRGEVKLELADNGFFVGFQHNVFLRDACFNCASNGECRFSDFTVADFWGLGKIQPFHHDMERPKGISMLALNSDKAHAFFDTFADSLAYEQRSYAEASVSNHQYYRPVVPSPRRHEFREEWDKLSWEELTQKYFQYTPKEKVLYAKKKIHPPRFVILC